jgi:hypothetical protein
MLKINPFDKRPRPHQAAHTSSEDRIATEKRIG